MRPYSISPKKRDMIKTKGLSLDLRVVIPRSESVYKNLEKQNPIPKVTAQQISDFRLQLK